MTRPLRVFLCHASQDKPAVRELYNALKLEGWIDPWLDKVKILPGQDWEIVIEKAVDDSDVVLACLSNHAVTKEGFVQREIRYAYDIALEKPDDTIFLIPLRLDDCNVPRKLRTLHWVDYFGADKKNSYFNLLESLKLRYEQKLRLEAGELERKQREKEEREKEEREAAERIAREEAASKKLELEILEKVKREKVIAERKVAEKAASENANREARDKVNREKVNLEIMEKSVREKVEKSVAEREKREAKVEPTVTHVVTKFEPKKQAKLIFKMQYIVFLILAFLILLAWGAGSLFVSPKSTQILSATPITVTGEDGMTLLYVPAGKFTMGSSANNNNEKPAHIVYLDAFWIDQTEVTNAMYKKCVGAAACKEPSSISSYTHPSYYNNSEFDNYPVIYVDWNMAQTYCFWAGRRLPTEAEWEKAARDVDSYLWGIDCNKANYNDSCVGDTSPVKGYPNSVSAFGAYDMAGNVLEWVNDWYSETYYENSPSSNPFGPDIGEYRVLRGGAWNLYDFYVRSTARNHNTPTLADNNIGFRCSRSP